MQKSWAFSLALDMSTHMSISYLDIRLRLYLLSYGIINVHFLAISVYERHTGEVIFLTATEALDAMCPEWRDIIVGGSSDGESKMTGCVSGCITRFQREAKPGFIRVWCGAHQFDPVLQSVYVEFGDEVFYQELTSVIGYLRRQQNLIKDMKTTCPKLADTRWDLWPKSAAGSCRIVSTFVLTLNGRIHRANLRQNGGFTLWFSFPSQNVLRLHSSSSRATR